MLSLHVSDIYAQKRGIGKKFILAIRTVMIDEKVYLVAGDFNGAAWRCDNRNNLSIIEEALTDCALPMLPGPTPLRGRGAIPGNWADVCGFLKPPDSDGQWKVRQHGAFSISDVMRATIRCPRDRRPFAVGTYDWALPFDENNAYVLTK